MVNIIIASLISLTGVIQDNQYTVAALADNHKFVDLTEQPVLYSIPAIAVAAVALDSQAVALDSQLSFALADSKGEILITVKPDGTVEVNPNIKADEAARRFIEVLKLLAPNSFGCVK